MQANEDTEIQETMLKHSQYIRKFSKIVRCVCYIFIFFANINPLLENNLLLPTSVPGINTNTTTFFWIMYILQIIELYFVIILLLEFVQSYISFVVFGIAQIEVLNRRISLIGVNKNSIQAELKECSIFHLKIIE